MMSISTLVAFVIITTIMMEDAYGQRCWIECDSPDKADSTGVSRKQGPPGKRGPSGSRGPQGEKGESGEKQSNSEEIENLKAKYNEVKEQLRLVQDSVTKNGDEIKAHDERLRSQNETAASSAQEQLNRHENRLEKVETKVNLLLSHTGMISSFTLTPRTGSFDEVRQMCQNGGGELATSPFESRGVRFREKIFSLVDGQSTGYFWVGIHDRREEGHFEFINGRTFDGDDTSLTVTWRSGEPNNYKGVEDCAVFEKGLKTLNDGVCEASFYGICEIKDLI